MEDAVSEPEPIDRLLEIMARLRGDGGCPWDREQDHHTLKKYALEEVYELLDAIESGSDEALCEELGDVLLQVVFHAQMASERGAFGFQDVAERIGRKLVARHPHVFGDRQVRDAAEVLTNWEEIKKTEKGDAAARSRFAGLPRALPALLMAVRIREKARSAGKEEELLRAISTELPTKETIGRYLEDVALLADAWGLNPEEELRKRNLARIRKYEEELGEC